jgi:phospholipid/cholesterol/gamma-HCH transport system substrate-binding protein
VAEHTVGVRHRLLARRASGFGLILVVFALVWTSTAAYRGVFTRRVSVTLRTDHVGNQLQQASDVKVRGLLVGEVRKISTKGNGAELELALQPDKVNMIPANVTARLLPKTLFGERYVDLEAPKQASSKHLKSGDVITQDRSSSAIELDRVLGNLMPLLQAVQPQKLSTTLTALSQALQNRGQPLGQTMVQLDAYLGQFNQQLPNLETDLKQLATFTDTYSQAAPDLVRALSDMAVTSQTVVQQQRNLANLYSTLTVTSQDFTSFLQANKDNLIQLAAASRPTLELVARYSPEYPCVLRQLADLLPRADAVAGKGTDQPGIHVTFEVSLATGTQYLPGKDTIRYGEHRGPHCYDPTQPFPDVHLDDGTRHVRGEGPAGTGPAPVSTAPSASAGAGLGLPNSPAESRFLAALLAPGYGVSPAEMPTWTGVLLGPLFRGTEVRTG